MGIVAEFENELYRHSPQEYGRWLKVDLHNHSPASHDYQGNLATAASESAQQIRDSNTEIVMFTDHERLPDQQFIEEVATKSGKKILSGVELNVFVDAWGKPEGKVDKNLFFHLLIGFDPESREGADYWLTHIYRTCDEQTRDSGGTKIRGVSKSIDEICGILKQANALVIPAHLHSTRDAFKSRSVDDIYSDPEFLRCARDHFTALEVTKLETAVFFDGNHQETNSLRKSCIRSSDAHTPSKLGTRTTYVQMEQPTFRELKAGLEIPDRTSLALPIEPASYICGVNIRGQFFRDLWLSLSPHCNALIGVKGSGKTSILECLRFALGAQVPASRKDTVDAHIQSILGTAGSVRVLIKRSDGAKILVERAMTQNAFKVTFEDNRQELFTSADGIMFPSYILGWHEIEQAATDPKIRQVYLDTIAGRDQIRQLQEDADTTTKRIQYLHNETANRHVAYRALHEQIIRLEELRKGLQELTDQNLIELRNKYDSAIAHRDAVNELQKSAQENLNQLALRVSALDIKAEQVSFEGESPISGESERAYAWIEQLRTHLSSFSEAHRARVVELLGRVSELIPEINNAFGIFLADFQKRVNTLPDEKRRLLDSHRKIMEDTKALPRLLLEKETQKNEIEKLLSELITLSENVANSLDSQTKLRQEKVQEMNQQLLAFGVRLSVEPLSRGARLEELMSKYASGGRIFGELATFSASEKRLHRRLATAYKSLKSDLLKGFHLFFDSPEFSHFVSFFEEDDLKITFRADKAGEEFSPIDQLSAGQRCTAVFPLLLKLRQGPLIVDQPEDNLDNRHIANFIAPALSKDKQNRQIAFTSHNANLVVLTDAEHIAMFEASGSQGCAQRRGFLCTNQSAITKDVVEILDGGEKALQFRFRKYGSKHTSL